LDSAKATSTIRNGKRRMTRSMSLNYPENT
jgi:hypothetical protein